MTVGALDWSGSLGADVHGIAPVPTRALDTALFFSVPDPATGDFAWKNLTELKAIHPGAAPLFTPRLAGTVVVGRATQAHGVAVNLDTGRVSFLPAWPTADTLWTFLVEATVTGVPLTPDFQPITIRVYLHEGIDVLWLTPPDLVIRPGNGRDASQWLTVLARFDDGVIGDVTADVPTWTQTGWSVASAGGGISVDPRTGRLWTAQDHGWATIDLDLPAIGTGSPLVASADVGAETAWSAERPLKWLGGRGPDAFADVPNILFVAEGFTKTPDEETNFDGYIQEVRKRVGERVFRPYDTAPTSVNFWSVFLDSWAPGPSVLTAHSLIAKAPGKAKATPIPPSAPLTGPGPWTLEQLIGQVGLPVPAYERTSPTDPDREAYWQTLYGAHVKHADYGAAAAPPAKIPALQAWKAMADWTFLEEAGTAFGLCHGSIPREHQPGPVRGIGTHPRRATEIDLDEFFGGLAYPPGQPIGGLLWGAGGKDRALVCCIYRSPRYGGQRNPTFYVSSTGPGDASGDVLSVTPWGPRTTPRTTIDFSPPPRGPFRLALNSAAVVAHELAHALGLGDEYGGHDTAAPPVSFADTVNADGNLRHAATVTASGAIAMATTPWQVWPRISKAGLTAFEPTPAADGRMTVLMEAFQAKRFDAKDAVQLRERDLVVDVTNYAATASDTLIVEAVNGDEITLSAPPGSALPAPSDFPLGSVLIGVSLDAAGKPLPLLSKLIKDHIETTQLPINRTAGAACAVPLFNGLPSKDSIMYAKNLPPHLLTPSPPPEHIVGLYDGGREYNCGVFHPTGICLMRRIVVEVEASPVGGVYVPGVPYSFCHVCRYILADKLNPGAHALIDPPYSKHYPT